MKCKDIEEANNIIRVEIHCNKSKVNHLKKKFKLNNIVDFLNYGNIICKYVFNKYIPCFFGAGDFYKLDYVRNCIEKFNYKEKTKKTMIELV